LKEEFVRTVACVLGAVSFVAEKTVGANEALLELKDLEPKDKGCALENEVVEAATRLVKEVVPAPRAGRPVDRLLEAMAVDRTGILSMLSQAGEPSKEFLDLFELESWNSSDLRFEVECLIRG
jgi:hypothetical protein